VLAPWKSIRDIHIEPQHVFGNENKSSSRVFLDDAITLLTVLLTMLIGLQASRNESSVIVRERKMIQAYNLQIYMLLSLDVPLRPSL
jgi:hypothetical protein